MAVSPVDGVRASTAALLAALAPRVTPPRLAEQLVPALATLAVDPELVVRLKVRAAIPPPPSVMAAPLCRAESRERERGK